MPQLLNDLAVLIGITALLGAADWAITTGWSKVAQARKARRD